MRLRITIYLFFAFGLLSLSKGQGRLLTNYQRGIFLEAGASSVGYSLNIEQVVFHRSNFAATLRLGGGATSVDAYVPLGFHLIFLEGKHHLLLAPTATVRVEMKAPFEVNNTDTFLHLQGGIGYRFQSHNSRIFVQALFSPGFMLDPTRTQITEEDPVFQTRVGAALGIKL